MFADETSPTLDRLTSWAGRVATKYKAPAKNIQTVQSAIKDVRAAGRPVSATDASNIELANRGRKDEIFGINATYVYIGAGLLIAGGIGYIVWNRIKN